MKKHSDDRIGVTGDLFENLDDAADTSVEKAPAKRVAPSKPTRADTLDDTQRLLDVLDRWVERGWLRTLDAAFARFLWSEVRETPPLLLLAAALASHQLGRGHVCLDLRATLDDPAFALSLPPDGPPLAAESEPPPAPAEVLAGVTLAQWQAALDTPAPVADGPGSTPLVLSGTRLYLRRYWQYEQDVRAGIERRLARSAQLEADLPPASVRGALDVLFPPRDADARGADWQKLACALAARSAFSIVTGGPGTGKTTTVVKLLALLQTLALNRAGGDGHTARPLRIRLAAPTGKAAARLNESIAGAVARLPLDGLTDGDALRGAIPTVVTTLHRVLGTRPDSRRFRHDAANPLPVDVLVIDEASMVDLEMMAAVLDALPASARLILLGDKDQLASVEAGAVLGELCDRAHEGHYTLATRDWLEAATGERIDAAMLDANGTPLDQSIAMLRESHRFAADSGIGALAELVNAGDAVGVAKVWARGFGDLARVVSSATDDAAFGALAIDGVAGDAMQPRRGYRHYLDVMREQRPDADADADTLARWAAAVLDAHGAFQLLCALRRGPWGVEGLNRRVARLLHAQGLIEPRGEWYAGRPVLVTHNDYELGLMNGDIGIALALPGGRTDAPVLRVAFPAGDGSGGIKWVSPSRLQSVETVFALTVHKSQGSEFAHAALVLPDTFSPILTRELVYTGITRARAFLTLVVPEGRSVLDDAVQAKVQRASGLMTGLVGGSARG
ncbi:exodeoxyribonuclease V subunit alpha [Paraburkholderia caballeronis]|uniref:RecBCD enzyme subunit RecD n=1 Tax=Paraburkholderia caballeronis TaxID=416943 RepID=A0A1H7S459_9BURK|nr:exodeoxyribonuclease V subunit alpha [Paraburkholderia caballeronis]PXW22872.1 DNA helicase/exodeoxyribonuclease V alpha subunit [Paraburkholderia caballeronis]PXW97257.1 DNA helicase/exodeoxyribonuclease V alpha subunit [Paraburkholderia caballeronis]RAJ93777.1 DNA helicase/exodeoxyribonuclease V alpha subunit [Paraburkholderia caballeronis]SED59188.1 DNA helicase/exodeoxyribonuclease V, alpha subunit [Paraburkholderia caballeronis]SEL67303.1 DNA helicase/exodeoxyribonuclease V, alpha subu